MRVSPFAAALLTLAACTPVEPPEAEPPDEPYQPPQAAGCGATDLQYLEGQPQSVLAGMTFPASTRIIGPDTVVTMDFNPQRLNIRYNEQGIITEVACG